MDRRNWLRGLTALSLAGFGAAGWGQKPAKKGAVKVEDLQKNLKTLLAEGADVAASTEPLKLSDAEWKKRLSPAAYDVLRHEGTERAGTSPLDREKRPGVFVCAGCSLPLFTSAMKFDSGTDGRVFSLRYPAYSGPRPTASSSWSAPNTTACAAAGITATSSTMGPTRLACATATTASRCDSSPRGRHRNPPKAPSR